MRSSEEAPSSPRAVSSHAGPADRAREAIRQALPLTDGETRAGLLHLGGVIEERTGSLQEACNTLLQGVAASNDPPRKLEMLMEAGEAAASSGDLARAIEIGRTAASIPAASARDRLIVGVGTPPGLAQPAAVTLEQQALELIATSSFDLACAAAEEGYRLSLDIGHGRGGHLVNMAMAEAVWGREQDARHHAGEALTLGQRNRSNFLVTLAENTLGFLDLSMGSPLGRRSPDAGAAGPARSVRGAAGGTRPG